MSRRFIDDHVELRTNSLDGLPSQDNQYYDPGHLFLDPVSGVRFTNEGANDRNSSLFVTDRYNALILEEKFGLRPVLVADSSVSFSSVTIALAGTNAADAGATFQTASGNVGGIKLTTTTATNDQLILIGNTNSLFGNVICLADHQVVFETQIVTDASIASATIWAGLKLTNTSVTATDNDQTFFRYNDATDGGKWQVIDSNNNVDTIQDTGVVVATATAYLLQVKVGYDLAPRYYINGVYVATGQPLRTGQSLKPFVGVQTTTNAAKAITVRYERIVLPRNPIV